MKLLDGKTSALLDAAPDPMVIVDHQGDIVFANACIETTFGYTLAELLGSPVETLIPERYRASHRRHRRRYAQRPVIRPMGQAPELYGLRKDGTEFPVEISLGPFESDAGPCVWSAIRDSTIHKLLAQAKKFSDGMFQSVPAIILLLKPDGRITRINSYMEQLSGYRNHEVVGKDWFTTFLPDQDQVQLRELFDEVLLTGENQGHVNPIVTRAGALRQVEWHARILTDEHGCVTLLNVGHDVTERIAYEDALRKADEALREADRRKDEFLAMVSHELRTPLGAISNALELSGMLSDKDAIQKNQALMRRQVQKLTRLVDDLLDISRVKRGAVRIRQQTLDLRDIVRGAINDMQLLIDERAHSLSLSIPHDPVMVFVDPARMNQVLINLLGNAAKYTLPQGQIDVAMEETAAGARISVKDNGLGIPPDKLETVFEMFARVNDDGQGGHGIGLGLAKTFVEMQGGTINAYSAGEQRGSEFVIRIPAPAATDS